MAKVAAKKPAIKKGKAEPKKSGPVFIVSFETKIVRYKIPIENVADEATALVKFKKEYPVYGRMPLNFKCKKA